jgi:hypothetical protein
MYIDMKGLSGLSVTSLRRKIALMTNFFSKQQHEPFHVYLIVITSIHQREKANLFHINIHKQNAGLETLTVADKPVLGVGHSQPLASPPEVNSH